MLDSKFILVEASDQWKREFFIDDIDMSGKSIFDIFPGFSIDMKKKLDSAFEGLKGLQMRDEVKLSDGSVKKIIWHFDAWKNHLDSTVGVMLTAEDVTVIKELEYDLLKAKNLLAEKGKIAQIGSWEYEVATEKLTLSDATKKIFKIKKDSKISIKSLIGFCGEKEKEETIKKILFEAIENGTPWDKTIQITLSDSKDIWVKTIGRPKFKNGKCNRIIGTAQILSSEVVTKEKDKNNELDLLFDAAPSPMAVVDLDNGHIIKVNQELLNISSFEKTELEQKNCLELFEKNFRRTRFVKIANHTKKEIKGKLDLKDKDGKKKVLSIKGRLINDDSQLLCTVEDMSNDSRLVADLKDKVSSSEKELDKLLNFTRVVYHNIKGHAINYDLMFDFLEDAESEKEVKDTISVLRYSTKSLSENILDLREMVTIGNGIKTKKERLVLNDFIFRAEKNLAGELKMSRAKIINEIPDVLKVKSYPTFLENMLTNIISNAIKFRKQYKTPLITISNIITKTHTIISITDNGIGIDLKEKGDKLFKMATALGNDSESRGMGLFLVKHQMDIMKGQITVDSEPNEGTTINLLFPHKL